LPPKIIGGTLRPVRSKVLLPDDLAAILPIAAPAGRGRPRDGPASAT